MYECKCLGGIINISASSTTRNANMLLRETLRTPHNWNVAGGRFGPLGRINIFISSYNGVLNTTIGFSSVLASDLVCVVAGGDRVWGVTIARVDTITRLYGN